MELADTLLRTVFMYVVVFLVLRLMGKREIGKLSVLDLVISIMIAEIAVISIENTERSLLVTVSPIVILVLVQIGIASIALKSRAFRRMADGNPSVLVRDGKLNWQEMRRQRYNLDDLMSQLRENKLTDIDGVELAVLEANGKLSVIPKPAAASRPPAFAPDADATFPRVRFELLPIPLVMDGEVQEAGLAAIGRNREWLRSELKRRGVPAEERVFLCSVDHRGRLYVGLKS